jgi:uncharacterized protein YdaU (DUF1376 family)
VFLSLAAKGAYITMLAHAWAHGPIPNTPVAIAKAMCHSPACDPPVDALWAELESKWTLTPDGWINRRLEQTRAEQDAYRERRSHAGKLAAAARSNREPIVEQSLTNRSAIVHESFNPSPSSSPSPKIKIKSVSSEPESGSSPAAWEFPTKNGTPWVLTEAQVLDWQASYPSLSVDAECGKALAWLDANPARLKTPSGMARFLVGWFNRELRGATTVAQPMKPRRLGPNDPGYYDQLRREA